MFEFKNFENINYLIFVAIWVAILADYSLKQLQKKRANFASSEMLSRVTSHKPTKRPLIKWIIILFALALMGFSMLRPLGESYEEEINGSGLDLVVALDISKSMKACDIEGNSRLDVAKAILRNMMNGLKEDRVGLVVFAGETMVQSPLSYDKNAFLTFLDRVNPDLLSEQGTNLGGAIQTSIDRFATTASQTKVIVLLSDGEDPDTKHIEAAINEAKKKNIQIFTVGIGSEEGGYIPESRTFFGEIIYKKRSNGQYVLSKLAEAPLKKIANETKADYFRAADVKTANKVIKSLNNIKRIAVSGGKRIMRKELYWIPLFIAFFLLLFEWMISERIPYSREQDHWLKRI